MCVQDRYVGTLKHLELGDPVCEVEVGQGLQVWGHKLAPQAHYSLPLPGFDALKHFEIPLFSMLTMLPKVTSRTGLPEACRKSSSWDGMAGGAGPELRCDSPLGAGVGWPHTQPMALTCGGRGDGAANMHCEE
eukprot:CAMPEP_0117697444 /NCGR_PEP_ID=MMETSP0804-20121206/29235_1 /TAXON_ID=1074897 /ORGANISM="Tetraselmis astigmatica, Strain CCMP880" /LENGTH=132 /DNA_ID=CAMNT_0005511701 /DNA_START=608 /DNA_END=1007 /DNA_ORIENTATION=-